MQLDLRRLGVSSGFGRSCVDSPLTLYQGTGCSFHMTRKTTMRIGEIAALAGVNVQTIRYYERRGILAEPARTASGYRQYPADTVPLIRFIKRAQELGFTLLEIEDLIELRQNPRGGCGEVRRRAEEKQASVKQKIRDLRALDRVLAGLIERCEATGTALCCPILETLGTDQRRTGDDLEPASRKRRARARR